MDLREPAMNNGGKPWEYIPPKNDNESPEEIRRQRDMFRDLVANMIAEKWKGRTINDWTTDGSAEQRVLEIVAELEAGGK